MKLIVGAGNVEGTPQEIAALLRELGLRPDDLLPPPTAAAAVASRASTPYPSPLARPLLDPPHNELLVHDYEHDDGLAAGTRRRYVGAVRDLERHVSPKSLLDVTRDDVRAWERGLIDKCAHQRLTVLYGRNVGAPRVTCAKGEYDWTHDAPATCNPACPIFQRQQSGPTGRLKAAKHFYDWARERGLRDDNPAEWVLKRHQRLRPHAAHTNRKHAPTVQDVREILRALHETGTPRDVLAVLLLAKWGRRPQHTLLVNVEDLRGLHDAEGPCYADFTGARERTMNRNENTRTKLMGHLVAPIDLELRAYLLDAYLPWRARTHYLDASGPLVTGALTAPRLSVNLLTTEVLDAAMNHLARNAPSEAARRKWTAHADTQHPTRITPGSFRHFFTTVLEELGVSREERMTLRGDRLPGALEAYRHLDARRICAMYRMPDLLRPSEA